MYKYYLCWDQTTLCCVEKQVPIPVLLVHVQVLKGSQHVPEVVISNKLSVIRQRK